MKKSNYLFPALAFMFSSVALQSCLDDDDNDYSLRYPTAIVTVCPSSDGGFTMQLDDKTTLLPSNMAKSPFGDKEVRALVNYKAEKSAAETQNVNVNWIDSIRTKLPVVNPGENIDEKYGNDPLEIVKDWVTVAEDGYLTLRFRTIWGPTRIPHYINLVSGINPNDPFEFELRHDAKGDLAGTYGDALIAFNLNNLPRTNGEQVKIKLHWTSFTGKKSTEFDLNLRPKAEAPDAKDLMPLSIVK